MQVVKEEIRGPSISYESTGGRDPTRSQIHSHTRAPTPISLALPHSHSFTQSRIPSPAQTLIRTPISSAHALPTTPHPIHPALPPTTHLPLSSKYYARVFNVVASACSV